jgi:hypothetical protein
MRAIHKSVARHGTALLGVAALLLACTGAARAGAATVPESKFSIDQPATAQPAVAPSLTDPCALAPDQTGDCASLSPKFSIYTYNLGASVCSFTYVIDWGDGTRQTITKIAPPDGTRVFLVSYSYKDDQQKAYTITVTITGTYIGPGPPEECQGDSATLTFTLLAYVALGDSFSSGDGASDYYDDTGYTGTKCLRSSNAYPVLVARSLGNPDPDPEVPDNPAFDFQACAGAEIADFYGSQTTPGGDLVPPQISYLKGPSDEVGLVTFTIGGNDLGFGPMMQYCVLQATKKESCEKRYATAVDVLLKAIGQALPLLYLDIEGGTRLDPHAIVVATDYPRFFPLNQATKCPTGIPTRYFQPSDMTWINGVIARLDAKIAQAAAATDITFVDVYNAFNGHELCQPDPYLYGVSIPPITSFHPTINGQAVMAGLIERELGT